MPFQKAQPTRNPEICDLAEDWGKVVAPRAFGPAGPADDVDFDTLEQIAVDAAHALTKGTIEHFLRQDTQRLGPTQPCPQCGRQCPLTAAPRDLVIRGATVHYDEPVGHCPACRRDFFPSPWHLAP
jgi:hypothetical protein